MGAHAPFCGIPRCRTSGYEAPTDLNLMNIDSLRNTLYEVMQERSGEPGRFQTVPILNDVSERAGLRGVEQEQLLLTIWHDLVRTGYVAWGYDVVNANPPFCHLTARGRRLLENASRDPANPTGYLAYLRATASLNPVAESYIEEAVETYNAACFKATAVMVGGASESLLLEVRNTLVAKLNLLGQQVPPGLTDWRAKRVIDATEALLQSHARAMPRALAESFSTYYTAFAGQIRMVRNDAGHPKSVEPVRAEAVHSSLLIFPELAKLVSELTNWINNHLQ